MNKVLIINIENNMIQKIILLLKIVNCSKIINEIFEKSEFIKKNIDILKIEDFDYETHFNILYNFIKTYILLYNEIDDKCIEVIKEYLNVYWKKLSLT